MDDNDKTNNIELNKDNSLEISKQSVITNDDGSVTYLSQTTETKKGTGITVHRRDCSNLSNVKSRLIDVSWGDKDSEYLTKISIKTSSLSDILLDIVKVCSFLKINVTSFEKYTIDTFYNYKLEIKIKSIEEYNLLVNNLNKISSIKKIERI